MFAFARPIMNPHSKAADDDNPPTGIDPFTTPCIPFYNLKCRCTDKTAPFK